MATDSASVEAAHAAIRRLDRRKAEISRADDDHLHGRLYRPHRAGGICQAADGHQGDRRRQSRIRADRLNYVLSWVLAIVYVPRRQQRVRSAGAPGCRRKSAAREVRNEHRPSHFRRHPAHHARHHLLGRQAHANDQRVLRRRQPAHRAAKRLCAGRRLVQRRGVSRLLPGSRRFTAWTARSMRSDPWSHSAPCCF